MALSIDNNTEMTASDSLQSTRAHTTVVVDDPIEASASELLRPKRRRGRPLGSKTRTAHSHVSADEFAFLRAIAQGVDLTVASRQYLVWPGRPPERAALISFCQVLVGRITSGARELPDSSTARQMLTDLQALQIGVSPAPVTGDPAAEETRPPGTALQARPTLEEFASQFDEGMFGEAELIEMYAEEYPATSGPGPSPESGAASNEGLAAALVAAEPRALSNVARMEILLAAIDWLSAQLAVAPERGHRLEQWISLNSAQREAMNHAGVIVLGDLVDWIALRGERWFVDVPRYGTTRARALENWLLKWGVRPSAGLPALGMAGLAQRRAERPSALAPLSQATWPLELRGEVGTFRSERPNTFNATNDLEAVQAWFSIIQEKSSATQTSYRRAVERLVLWAIHERRTALSSLTTQNLLEFKAFLRNPPAHWVQEGNARKLKADADWRPLRAPLSDSSVVLTFAAVGAMFASWKSQGYIISNPAEGIATPKRETATMDVMRSFSVQNLQVIGETFRGLEEGSKKRRLAAIIRLLESSGLRREEVEKAKWGDLSRARLEGRDTDDLVLSVEGKGRRMRMVPINEATHQALLAHLADRQELAAEGALGHYRGVKLQDMPLIGILDERWIKGMAKKRGAEWRRSAGEAPQLVVDGMSTAHLEDWTVNSHGGLSASAMYSLLKGFFRECAVLAGEDLQAKGAMRGTFSKASTHWLRHTFAHHALRSSDKDLTVVQALLGHASINTTAIYIKADLGSRVATVAKISTAV
ncbi:tyrosine-type recombinase/integrase [Acidovorax facilis]|uniref:tyrosine-type recombinase/integrase n=1 Tax=Acidovorax facilis TaxID=12917 RepID=UPI003D64C120